VSVVAARALREPHSPSSCDRSPASNTDGARRSRKKRSAETCSRPSVGQTIDLAIRDRKSMVCFKW
jgi:hypothetical protein